MLLSNAAYSLTKSDVVTGCCRSRQPRAALQAILGLHGTRRQAKRGGGPHERDSAQPDAEAGSREAGQPANGPGQTRPGSGGPPGELLYRPRLTLRLVRGVSPHAHLSDESFPTILEPTGTNCSQRKESGQGINESGKRDYFLGLSATLVGIILFYYRSKFPGCPSA